MKKSEIAARFRNYVRNELSPTKQERGLVSDVYQSIQNLLGEAHCLQIGSYPRFTAITPIHDLDVLYVPGLWKDSSSDPSGPLDNLKKRLSSDYRNPTGFTLEVSRQTHSVTLKFSEKSSVVFSVDIVPAYIAGKNEFGDDTYIIPEIAASSHTDRRRILTEVVEGAHKMQWIRSDPRGYITVAARLNHNNNSDFRKSVKFIKGWRIACKSKYTAFPLKSFHLEQLLTQQFLRDPNTEIFDAVFNFFCDLPCAIDKAHIPDRADPTNNIDEYVESFTEDERIQIKEMRDYFLIKLEEISEKSDPVDLLQGDRYCRASSSESFLFDSHIPMLTEEELKIKARVLRRDGGFREIFLDRTGCIGSDRHIEFRLTKHSPSADIYKWKVKNDNNSPQPRGEITDHHTLRDPEVTKYKGHHFVECFAIRNGVCIGRARQNVVLNSSFGR